MFCTRMSMILQKQYLILYQMKDQYFAGMKWKNGRQVEFSCIVSVLIVFNEI